MLTTEAEAKTKRCQESFSSCSGVSTDGHMYAASSPMGHSWSGGAGGYAVQTAPSMCIGTTCMAWRWGEMPPESNRDRMGYCGKAGRP